MKLEGLRFAPALLAVFLFATPGQAGAEETIDTEKLYLKHCKNCHGTDGKADTKMGRKHEIDSFVDAAWQAKFSDEEIRKAIADGKEGTKMKAYSRKMSAEEIEAMVQKVRSFKP